MDAEQPALRQAQGGEQSRTTVSRQDIEASLPAEVTAVDEPSASRIVKLPALEQPGMGDELVTLNFDQVDIRTVLKTVGDITGVNFVVDDTVQGNVTVLSPSKIRLAEVWDVLESILEVKGYAAVPSGNFVKIIPRLEATKRNLEVRVGSDPAAIPQNDRLVTQILPLKFADAAEVSQIIKPLLRADAHLATYPRTNAIIVTDTSSNIYHIATVIQKLDVAGSKELVSVIRLRYASAQVVSEQVTRIIEKSKTSATQPGRASANPDSAVRILPDARTNSLIVVANSQETKTVETLVAQLDVEQPSGAGNIHVVYLKNAPAKETAESLKAALANLRITGAVDPAQNIQVTADEGTNALIISAPPQDFKVVADIIEKLDIVREQVLVEMLIMEASDDSLQELGVDWATLDEAVERSVRGFAATNFGPRVDYVGGDFEGLSVGAFRGSGSNVRIGAIINALEKQSGVNILSTPRITTSNHHKAKIIVGENRPFVMESRITETTDFITPTVIKTFEYKDVGIMLEITPHISQAGLVRLEINSEFTKLIEDVTTTSTDTPTTAKRQAQTVVSMNSGATIVIGGLIRDDKVSIEKKIPLLGDIPIAGALFKYQKHRVQKTNLLIFITPHVLSNPEDLQRMTESQKEQMRPAMEKPGSGK